MSSQSSVRERDTHSGHSSRAIMFKLILFISYSIYLVHAKRQIPLGGIFDEDKYEVELAFLTAIDRINYYEKNFELVPVVRHAVDYNSYITEKLTCQFAMTGVAAIFGPNSMQTAGSVESVCSELDMPHIAAYWKPEPFDLNSYKRPHAMSINVYPESNLLSQALSDLIVDYSWKSLAIMYEDNEGLMRLKDVLQNDIPFMIRQLPDDGDYGPILKEIQKAGEGHIVIDCNNDKVIEILRQASKLKMMEEYQSYVLTSLDTHNLDFEEIALLRANITTLRLFDPDNDELKTFVNGMMQREKRDGRVFRLTSQTIKVESVLMLDAVNIIVDAIRAFEDSGETVDVDSIDCNGNTTVKWEFGAPLVDSIKKQFEEGSPIEGVSGEILFNEHGQRIHFKLDIIELSKGELKKIAQWVPVEGVIYTRTSSEVDSLIIESLQNKTVRVVSRIGPPFLMYRAPKDGETYEGNQRFEGYSLDLIDGVSKILKFNYVFEIVPDNRYGSYDKEKKEWDGLIRHLLDRKADLAICDLTITYERRSAVDFTMPFMTLGISILFAKPVQEDPELFSFLQPLSLDVWIYMATAYMGVSILLFVLARMAPDDWESSHPCDQEPYEVENIWNMQNCTWLTMGSIMGQGCDLLPKALSTRLVAGMWWFFALIMLASYTANLAAFLTMVRMDAPIESAADLAKQTKIKYGAVEGGSTLSFFKQSNFTTYQKMWSAMEATRPSVFTKSNQEGTDRVQKGKRLYAFLMESTSLEYIIERNCDLTQIGGLLDNKGYGIAMPTNSPYRTAISGAVLKMQEGGSLQALKAKWWKEMHGGGVCKKEESASDDNAAELGIGNVGGVFVVLAFGCGMGLIIGSLEFLWNVHKVAVKEKLTPLEALKAEARFACQIWITTKPVHPVTSSSLSTTKSSKATLARESMDNTDENRSIRKGQSSLSINRNN